MDEFKEEAFSMLPAPLNVTNITVPPNKNTPILLNENNKNKKNNVLGLLNNNSKKNIITSSTTYKQNNELLLSNNMSETTVNNSLTDLVLSNEQIDTPTPPTTQIELTSPFESLKNKNNKSSTPVLPRTPSSPSILKSQDTYIPTPSPPASPPSSPPKLTTRVTNNKLVLKPKVKRTNKSNNVPKKRPNMNLNAFLTNKRTKRITTPNNHSTHVVTNTLNNIQNSENLPPKVPTKTKTKSVGYYSSIVDASKNTHDSSDVEARIQKYERQSAANNHSIENLNTSFQKLVSKADEQHQLFVESLDEALRHQLDVTNLRNQVLITAHRTRIQSYYEKVDQKCTYLTQLLDEIENENL